MNQQLLMPEPTKQIEDDPIKVRLFNLFRRRLTRRMDAKELKAFKQANITEEDLQTLEDYYYDEHPEWDGQDYRRRDLITLLNNFNADCDKADYWKAFPPNGPAPTPIFKRNT